MITEAANWFFATVVINLLSDFVLQNGLNLNKFRDAIIFHRVMDLCSCTELNVRF